MVGQKEEATFAMWIVLPPHTVYWIYDELNYTNTQHYYTLILKTLQIHKIKSEIYIFGAIIITKSTFHCEVFTKTKANKYKNRQFWKNEDVI